MAGKGRIENLKPFKKGQSGNPKGRAKKIPALDVLMAEVFGTDGVNVSAAQKVLETLRIAATTGKISSTRVRAAEVAANRLWGNTKSNDVLTLKHLTAEQIAESDKKAQDVIEKYNLMPRVKKQ